MQQHHAIDSLTKINKLNGVQNVHTQRINELSKKEKPQINTFEIKDLKNMASEALGRSQVTAQVDNHENNVLFMLKHPDQVKQANAFFDNTYETLKKGNVEDAYEKATQYTGAFKDEFLSK